MNSVSISSQLLQTPAGCSCQSANKAAVSKWKQPPTVKYFLQFLIGPLVHQHSAHKKARAETAAFFPIAWLDTHSKKPPAQMPNKCSQPERDTGVFTGLCNQLVKLEETKSGERQEEPSRVPLPHLLVRRIATTCLLTNKDVKALFISWLLHW